MAAAMTDPDIERLLREALNVPPPREHRLKMLRAAVEREWRNAISEPRVISVRRRVVRRGLAAAAAVAAVTVMVWVARSPSPTESLGSMSRHDGGGVAVRAGLFQHRDLKDGEALRVGDRLTTRGGAP